MILASAGVTRNRQGVRLPFATGTSAALSDRVYGGAEYAGGGTESIGAVDEEQGPWRGALFSARSFHVRGSNIR